MRVLFTATIFLGSLLLFLIQPIIAKMVLPYFGGTPAVWNTSMVFFQAALLAGYAYAHYGPKLLGNRIHAGLHIALFAAGALALPFGIQSGFNPSKSAQPEWLVLLGFLALAVGLPYFVVSAGAPLLQKWFARTRDPAAKDPYFLYAASNVGSLAALLGYPFWFEREFSLAEQSWIWKGGFLVLAAAVLACALMGLRGEGPAEVAAQPAEAEPPPPWRKRLRWLLLSAVPSSILLGVTTYLTTNLAAIPLLWVIPLSIYLLSFILAFSSRPLLPSRTWGRIAALLLAPMTLLLVLESSTPFVLISAFHLLVFFVAAMMCHTELAETRPGAAHLTEFYLWISIGGVVGGAFNAILAPILFQQILEYDIALILAAFLRWQPGKEQSDKERPHRFDIVWAASIAFLTLAVWAGFNAFFRSNPQLQWGQLRTAITMGIPALLCFLAIDRPIRYAASLAAFLGMAVLIGMSVGGKLIYSHRSFFGVHRITEWKADGFRQLVHGTTIHGRQSTKPENETVPLTYYYPTGPIGQLMGAYLPLRPNAEVALVGLGVGSLASYGRPGDRFTFFEIDPVVIEIAHEERFFTYLSKSNAEIEIVEGDARLSLVEQPDSRFDMIVLDAFSSDAIPVHLITLEAIDVYFQKLRPGGILALHISNRYLDLAPILAGAARAKGLAGALQEDYAENPVEEEEGKTSSVWFVMARTDEDLKPIAKDNRWDKLRDLKFQRPWTDDRSNLLEAWASD